MLFLFLGLHSLVEEVLIQRIQYTLKHLGHGIKVTEKSHNMTTYFYAAQEPVLLTHYKVKKNCILRRIHNKMA